MAVSNVKALKRLDELDMKPLTLLLGPNSSGKSTFFQSILLLKQTLESRNREVALVLRGKYVDVGSYSDLVSEHDVNNTIAISLSFNNNKSMSKMMSSDADDYLASMTFKIGYDIESKLITSRGLDLSIPDDLELRIMGDSLNVSSGKISGIFSLKKMGIEKRNFLYLSTPGFVASSISREGMLIRGEYNESRHAIERYTQKRIEIEKEYADAQKKLAKEPEAVRLEKLKEIEKEIAVSTERLRIYQKRMNRVESLLTKNFGTSSIEEFESLYEALRKLRNSSSAVQTMLIERTYYIGPLREYPQRYYIASGEYPSDVGLTGESTTEIIYYDFRQNERQLNRLKYWIKALGLASDIDLKLNSMTEGMYALMVTDPQLGIEVNIADIGFGASQLLPILVEGIYAKKGSILLIEQPEIHLHPRLQSVLADFFIELIAEGKQLIIETHSEHIILRVQRRIAEGTVSNRDIAIHYFEGTKDGSQVTTLKLEKEGTIKEWPKGFFDEDLNDSFLFLEALGKKRELS